MWHRCVHFFPHWLGSRLARQSFFILISGLFLIASAWVSVFSFYLLYGRHPTSPRLIAADVIRAVVIARVIPIAQLPEAIAVLNQPGIRVSMVQSPPPLAQIIELADPGSLKAAVFKQPYEFLLSVPLANGQWLVIHGHRMRSDWVVLGAWISSFFLFLTLIFLSYWVIRRLALPLHAFGEAAERFGVDMQAPPMALEGPQEMQAVITSFNAMQSRIRRLMNDRTQMIAAISHDLRTPITRLQLRAEFLQGTTQYQKALDDLHEMECMIASILSFARDYTDVETMERFDINALLESIANDFHDLGHLIAYAGPATRTPYFGRIFALKRSVTNIVENGLKYADKVDLTLKIKPEALHILVQDNGPGIAEEEREKVFAPFYRVDASRSLQKSGSGLGLAVARDIIRARGGDILLSTPEKGGLLVRIILPLEH